MEFRYTEHAEENIKERELNKAIIESVIKILRRPYKAKLVEK